MQKEEKIQKAKSLQDVRQELVMKNYCDSRVKQIIDDKKFIEKPGWFWIGILAFVFSVSIGLLVGLLAFLYNEQRKFYIQKIEDLKNFYQEKIIDYKTYDKICHTGTLNKNK